MIIRHTKPKQQGQQGGRIEREAPINASNVMLLCGKCNKATRVAHAFRDDKSVRVCKKCGSDID
jgi:large subunit ribosomal protein L24